MLTSKFTNFFPKVGGKCQKSWTTSIIARLALPRVSCLPKVLHSATISVVILTTLRCVSFSDVLYLHIANKCTSIEVNLKPFSTVSPKLSIFFCTKMVQHLFIVLKVSSSGKRYSKHQFTTNRFTQTGNTVLFSYLVYMFAVYL